MKNLKMLAKWWCELNRWEVPSDLYRLGFKNEEEKHAFITGAFAVVNAIAGKEGVAKWKKDRA